MDRDKFRSRLREQGYPTYAAYLRSDHWADARRRYFASRLWKGRCEGCGTKAGPFDVHHRTYKRIGAEWLKDFAGVCRPCHDAIHERERLTPRWSLWTATKRTLKRRRRQAVSIR